MKSASSSAIRRRRTSRPRSQSGRQKAWTVVKWGAIVSLAGGALFSALVAVMFWVYGSDPNLSQITSVADYRPLQVTRVVTEDGTVIGEIYQQRRTFVPYEQLPKNLIHAFVSAEDANFFRHKGLDYVGMVRALWVNIRAGEHRQGGSTITQQVVKNLLLTRAKTLRRKFQEIILSRRLENLLSKEEILTLYANEIYFGEGRYGVEEASRFYFGVTVSELNLGQCALLAGIPQTPNRYSPKRTKNREAAKTRQAYVLRQMAANGYIGPEDAEAWIKKPIKELLGGDGAREMGVAPEWVDLVRSELVEQYGAEEVPRMGAEVVVSLDLETQKVAQEALREGLIAYDRRKGYGRPVRSVSSKRIPQQVKKLARSLPKGGPKKGRETLGVVVRVDDDAQELVVDLGNWKGSVLLVPDVRQNPEKLPPSKRFKVGDVIRVVRPEDGELPEDRQARHTDRPLLLASGPEGAVVVIEPNTRQLLALVGGFDHQAGQFNRATMAKRQAGSTFKPFVYAAALDTGEFTPATLVDDSPEVYDLWKPENYKKGEFQGPVRLRVALAKSINTVAIKVANDIGPSRVASIARAMGIESKLPETLSLALGSGEVTPIELTNAFATFAAGGRSATLEVVREIRGGSTKEASLSPPTFRQALRPEVAYVALDMMRSVVTEGTGARAGVLKMDVAGKTGTSNDARDAWFIGLSPGRAVGVWIGFDDFRRPLGRREGGSQTALPVFVSVMNKIGDPSATFVAPEGVEEASIDAASGKLAAPGVVEGVYSEVFVSGTVPTETAPAPGEVTVDDYILDQYQDPYASDAGAADNPPPDAGAAP